LADYFKPEHLEKYPNLHDMFWKAIKQAGQCKHHNDPAEGQKLLDQIDEIAKIFWETKKPKLLLVRRVARPKYATGA